MQIQKVNCVFSVFYSVNICTQQGGNFCYNNNISQVSDVFHFELRSKHGIDNRKLF